MAGRRASRIADDDKGIAGVVGAVLLLALVFTVYAQTVREELPVQALAAERAWSESAAEALVGLARAAPDGLGTGAPVTMVVPRPTAGDGLHLPLVGRLTLPPAGAYVSSRSDCGGLNATHAWGGSQVTDLVNGSRGCIEATLSPTHMDPVMYRYEHGGVLRVEGGRAAVLVGPPIDVARLPQDELRVALTLVGLEADTQSVGLDRAGVRVALAPGPVMMERANGVNAGVVNWTLRTQHPDAWVTWFDLRLRAAGLQADEFSVTCADACQPHDGRWSVAVVIEGPQTAADDLRYSLNHGLYRVALH